MLIILMTYRNTLQEKLINIKIPEDKQTLMSGSVCWIKETEKLKLFCEEFLKYCIATEVLILLKSTILHNFSIKMFIILKFLLFFVIK